MVERRGWTLLRINGSHHIYGKTGSTVRLSIPIHGNQALKRGPKSDDPKQLVSLRLDAEVLRWFKRTGAGYQSRIGDVLKRHVSRQSAARKKKAG
jgi:uncharacterized protein (DUF4415 family)